MLSQPCASGAAAQAVCGSARLFQTDAMAVRIRNALIVMGRDAGPLTRDEFRSDMTTALQTAAPTAQTIERVLVEGDLSKLTSEQRLAYYNQVCQSLGLNPLTKPFSYLNLNGKLTLYALRDATDQLRKINKVSIEIVERQLVDDLYVVRARATLPDGRVDESLGAVNMNNLRGEAKANALMKCETKAKRRVTLSVCGLGWLDETEADTIPNAVPRDGLAKTEGQLAALAANDEVDAETGEIAEPEPERPDGLYVLTVDDSRKGQNKRGPWTLYKVQLTDGRTLSTFDANLGAQAKLAAERNLPVEVQVDGRDLTDLTVFDAADVDPSHPPVVRDLTDSDIPF